MSKKGFTLMELLGVIVILSLLAMIATLSITSMVRKSKENLYETQLESIRISAELWGVDNINKLPNTGECMYITLGTLKGFAILDEDVIDAKNNKKISDDLKIKITATSDKFSNIKYTYEVNPTDIEGCKEIKINYLAKENVSKVENPTINGANVGITPEVDENGNFLPGSTFNIKVNNQDTDGSIFYVLSNEGEYVNLIAQQNITIDGNFTSELQDNDEWYKLQSDNRYGPQTAYTYLSQATSNWTNIPIIESFSYFDEGNQENSSYGYQSIITELDETTKNYITTITPLSTSYGSLVTYENMRARLPYVSEVISSEVGCTTASGLCPLWIANYLYSSSYYSEDTGKINSLRDNLGYWLLSSYLGDGISVRYVTNNGNVSYARTSNTHFGVRPVITVLKTDLLMAM